MNIKEKCRVSSAVEQRFCKPQAVGSNPTSGSEKRAGNRDFTSLSANRPKRTERQNNGQGSAQDSAQRVPQAFATLHRQMDAVIRSQITWPSPEIERLSRRIRCGLWACANNHPPAPSIVRGLYEDTEALGKARAERERQS
jgi:hypothetical protein